MDGSKSAESVETILKRLERETDENRAKGQEQSLNKAGEKPDNSKNFLWELISREMTPDYLLEDTKCAIETFLTLKNNEQRQQAIYNHTQRLERTKRYLREEYAKAPWPTKADDILTAYCDFIDELDRWFISGIKGGRVNWERHRELNNKINTIFIRDTVFNQHCADYEQKRIDQLREKEKQLPQKLNNERLASNQTKAGQTVGGLKKNKMPKEPSDEAKKAYQLYGVCDNQTIVAEQLNKELKRNDFTQSKVSRLISQYREWLNVADLSDVNQKPKTKVETVSPDFIEMGKRRDGSKAAGSQLNKCR